MNNTRIWSQLYLRCRLREGVISGHSRCVTIVEIILFPVKYGSVEYTGLVSLMVTSIVDFDTHGRLILDLDVVIENCNK